MALREDIIQVSFDIDNSPLMALEKQMSGTYSGKMDSQVSSIEKSAKSLGKAMQGSATDAKKLHQSLDQTSNAAKSLDKASSGADKLSEGIADAAGASKKTGGALGVVSKVAEKLGGAGRKVASGLGGALHSVGDAAQSATNAIVNTIKHAAKLGAAGMGKAFLGIGKAAVVGAAAAGTALGGLAAAGIKVGMDFEAGMSQVAATMGTTVDQIPELTQLAKDMGASTQFSASQSADAINYMALAGYTAQQTIDTLPTVLNLAAAGGMELAAASDMVTDSASALGLDMKQTTELVDQMSKASQRSNTNVAQLGDAILTVGGTAKGLAGGTVELNTVLGVMADKGIKGSEAGTHLRNVMMSLSGATPTAAKGLKKLGLETKDAYGNLRPMPDVMQELNAKLSKMGEADKVNALTDIFGKTDIAAVNALLSTSGERWDALSGEIANSTGAAAEQAKTMNDNLKGDIISMQSALEGLGVEAYEGNFAAPLRDITQEATGSVRTLTEAMKSGGLSGAVASLGGILSQWVNKIAGMAPGIMSAASELLNNFIAGISQNLPAILASAVEVGKIFIEGVQSALIGLLGAIAANADAIGQGAAELITSLVGFITQAAPQLLSTGMVLLIALINGITQQIPVMLPMIIQGVLGMVQALLDNLPAFIQAGIQLIVALANGLMQALPMLIQQAPILIQQLVDGCAQSADQLISAGIALIPVLIDGIIQNLPALIEAAIQIMVTLGVQMVENIGRLIEAVPLILSALGDALINTDWGEVGKSIMDGLKNGLAGAGGKLLDGIKGIFGAGGGEKEAASSGAKTATAFTNSFAQYSNVGAVSFDLGATGQKMGGELGATASSSFGASFHPTQYIDPSQATAPLSAAMTDLSALSSAAGNVSDDVAAKLGSLGAASSTTASEFANMAAAMNTASTDISGGMAEKLSSAGAACATTAADYASMAAKMNAAGVDVSGDMAAKLASTSTACTTASSDLSSLASTAQTSLSSMSTEATTQMAAFNATVQTGMTQAQATVQSGAQGVESAVRSVNLQAEGANMMRGFAQGILSQLGAVTAAARQVAGAAKATVQSQLQIHSPARAMMPDGANTTEGFAVGMLGSLQSAVGAAKTVAQSVLAATSGALSGGMQPAMAGGTPPAPTSYYTPENTIGAGNTASNTNNTTTNTTTNAPHFTMNLSQSSGNMATDVREMVFTAFDEYFASMDRRKNRRKD